MFSLKLNILQSTETFSFQTQLTNSPYPSPDHVFEAQTAGYDFGFMTKNVVFKVKYLENYVNVLCQTLLYNAIQSIDHVFSAAASNIFVL